MNLPLRSVIPIGFLLCASLTVHAQVKGSVSDASTSVPLHDVSVADSSGGTFASTGQNGEFSLPCTGPMTLVVSKAGYRPVHHAVVSCSETVRLKLVSSAQMLTAVNVVGTTERSPVEQPRATTTLGPQQLHRSAGLFLQDEINLTPGIYMQRRSMSGGQTIRIRGYSNGDDAGNFIGTGYKAYLNGIPITDAEGQTVLDDIDFANVGRVDVIRGPASSLYGAGIGGVVNFYSALPDEPGTAVSQAVTTGSDGLLRTDTRLSRVSDASTVMLDYGHQGYDSYRIHSASKKDYGSLIGDFRASNQQNISTYLSYANSREQRAGELDSVSFAHELNAGEDKYLKNNARSEIESFRAGVNHTYHHSDRVESVATGYYGGNVLDDVYAAGINSKSNQSFGARVILNTTFADAALPLRGSTGAEFEKTNVVAQGYGLTNSVLGPLRSDLETHNMAYNVFSQWTASLPADFSLTAGASANFLEYAIIDRMANTGNPTHADGSGRKTFKPVITPSVSLRKMFGSNISAYANVSQGYTPPTSSSAVIPYTGEPNEGLKPERATQYEVGSKGSFIDSRLSYQIALFDMRVTDKLSSQGVFDTDGTVLYSYAVNAGNQKNRGLELAAHYALIDNPAQLLSYVSPFVSYTYSDFKYSHFTSNNNSDATTVDYSGNRVVGAARNVVNAGVDARLRSGVYGNATYHKTGGMPISYDNVHWAPGFSLVNAKIGVVHDFNGRFSLDAFAGGENLGNSRYYTLVFLNHKWDSPTPPNMYLPGPYKAKFYGGLKVSVRP